MLKTPLRQVARIATRTGAGDLRGGYDSASLWGLQGVPTLRGKAGAINYEAPKIIDYGTLVELTAAQQDGDFTDKSFPVHTPKKDLTFS